MDALLQNAQSWSHLLDLIKESNSKAKKVLWIGSKDATSAEGFEVGSCHIAIQWVILVAVDGICRTKVK